VDAPARAGSPELIFLPDSGVIPPYYSSLFEDLASRGYKVIAIHPIGGAPVKWASYVRAVMDREQTATGLARFGLLGHSLGGAAAAEACRVDERCAAAVDLDGRLWNPVATEGLKRPLLMLLSEPSFVDTGIEMTGYERVLATAPGSELLRVNGMRRLNFTDWPFMFSPMLSASPLIGSINPLRGATITRIYVSAFFDRYLKNEDPPLMQGPSPEYPEVVWRR
jgi:pimeloyl-ACP methyl ester carboxylesterase